MKLTVILSTSINRATRLKRLTQIIQN